MTVFTIASSVLILVLVEDGLGLNSISSSGTASKKVLILVLVEDGLGPILARYRGRVEIVLILVLVEDGLGQISILFDKNSGTMS